MISPFRILLLLVVSSTSLSSSRDNGERDRELPVVTITSPTANQAFPNGSSVVIAGQLTDNVKISEVHVHITDVNSGDLIVDIHRYPGSSTYTLNETFIVVNGASYRIAVIAKDNSANENRSTVTISTF